MGALLHLDEAAIRSAWGAAFQPYVKNGQPIEVTLVLPMHLH
jgi:hypothetical protein